MFILVLQPSISSINTNELQLNVTSDDSQSTIQIDASLLSQLLQMDSSLLQQLQSHGIVISNETDDLQKDVLNIY